jgi:hypothetical protein
MPVFANPDRARDRRKRFTIGAHRVDSVSNMQGVCGNPCPHLGRNEFGFGHHAVPSKEHAYRLRGLRAALHAITMLRSVSLRQAVVQAAASFMSWRACRRSFEQRANEDDHDGFRRRFPRSISSALWSLVREPFGVADQLLESRGFQSSRSRSPDAACARRCSAISSADTDLLRWN